MMYCIHKNKRGGEKQKVLRDFLFQELHFTKGLNEVFRFHVFMTFHIFSSLFLGCSLFMFHCI